MDTPRDENILPQTIYTQKYPTVNFPKLQLLNCQAISALVLKHFHKNVYLN